MTKQKACEIMEKTVINGSPHVNTAEYLEALEISIDELGVDYTREQLKNWILINKYPFLIPKYWNKDTMSYEIRKDYDYTWTELDAMPDGWRKAFGEMMCEEIKEELVKYDYLDEYLILEIKEKFGGLRWYDGGVPTGCDIPQIIDKYSTLSENICIICGKPDVPMIGTLPSYVSPFCKKCYSMPSFEYKETHSEEEIDVWIETHKKKWDEFNNNRDNKMPDTYTVNRWFYENDNRALVRRDFTYDISETANKIRAKWRAEYGE